ncbi:MAG: NADPH-dependent F420 reductase [Thermoanaerobaculia bacterium]
MDVGILGSGVMGTALAKRLRAAGHRVVVGARSGATSYESAIRTSEIVFLAVGWPYGLDVVSGIRSFGDRVLVDVTNPEDETGRGLTIGHDTSGAEEIARSARNARVVKAFNHFYVELLTDPPVFSGGLPSVPYCGDDADAKLRVRDIITTCGLDAIDAGPLRIARYLEPFAMLTVQLVREQGWGPRGMAWRVMR